jgi:hypothetical protein
MLELKGIMSLIHLLVTLPFSISENSNKHNNNDKDENSGDCGCYKNRSLNGLINISKARIDKRSHKET